MTDQEFIESVIQLVRKGSFTAISNDSSAILRLKGLASRQDWQGAQSGAMLAEVLDQVGSYPESAEWANFQVGKQQVAALRREIRSANPARNSVRAHAWLILQCAVSQFRKENGRDDALELLKESIALISENRGEAVSSQHIQSLFYFWRGRINTVRYAFDQADEDFRMALQVADQTLEEKLSQVKTDLSPGEQEFQRQRHVTAGNYVLSACLGFGLGQLRQLEGRLVDSIYFLRVAVSLSRGNVDYHRRGYAHLLMGTVLRSQNQLDEADKELLEAMRLFGDPPNSDIPPHKLHLARVYHQLALSKYNRVPVGSEDQSMKAYLMEAEKLNQMAEKLSNHGSHANYHDAVLDYGIIVAGSLIDNGLGNYVKARQAADLAIGRRNLLPRGMHGWALVAKGMAVANEIHEEGQLGILDAEKAFTEVIEDTQMRSLDRAAAHLHLSRLYSRIGQPLRAALHYDRATPLVQGSEYGWIKSLQESAKAGLKESLGTSLTINLEELLETGKAHGEAWSYITSFVEGQLKRRLLHLKREELAADDGPTQVAHELGLAKATIYNWRNDPNLRDLFPTKRRKSR